MTDILNIASINQYYGQSHTLWDVDLSVPKGVCLCLMGRNGMGKTTLLKSLMGLIPVRDGSMQFDGHELTGQAAERRAHLGIGYVPQGRDIFPQLTVQENLQIGLAAMGRSVKRIPDRIFEMFPVLKDMLRRRGGDLSGGQQQQLAIGRALCLDPKLLILDEPTEGIQPNIVQQIGEVIRRLNHEEGLTVLLVEQKLPFARLAASRYAILDKGRMVASGEMAQLDDATVREYLSV